MKFLSRHFLLLQSGYLVFSLAGVFLKFGAGYSVLSTGFLLYYAGSLLCVFLFALVWQQVLRRYSLMTAYAWRGVTFLWTFLWAVLFFGEKISFQNILGAVFLICGMLLVTIDG